MEQKAGFAHLTDVQRYLGASMEYLERDARHGLI